MVVGITENISIDEDKVVENYIVDIANIFYLKVKDDVFIVEKEKVLQKNEINNIFKVFIEGKIIVKLEIVIVDVKVHEESIVSVNIVNVRMGILAVNKKNIMVVDGVNVENIIKVVVNVTDEVVVLIDREIRADDI